MIIVHFSQTLDLLLSQDSSVSPVTRLLAGILYYSLHALWLTTVP